jgi:hypothetical protein
MPPGRISVTLLAASNRSAGVIDGPQGAARILNRITVYHAYRQNVDIFKKTSDKDAVWLEAVQGLQQAKKRLLHHRFTSTGEYLVFDTIEAKFIDVWDEARSA